MAVKTITIDMEAYAALARHKRAGQSFSQVIKAHFGPQPTVGRFLEVLSERVKAARVSDDALGAIEGVVRDRARNPARVQTLSQTPGRRR